jgi:flagellar biosynthetic protein FliO
MNGTIIKAFLILASSVGIIALMFYFLKRFTMKIKDPAGTLNMKIISRLHLGSKSNLYIVNSGQKTLLIGVTDHNISTLADLTDEDKNISQITTGFTRKSNISSSQTQLPVEESLSFKSFLKSSIKKSN